MNQPHADNSCAGDPSDLDWLAQRYVLEELTAEETAAFEGRLSHDWAAAEALVRAVRLVGAIRTAGPAHVTQRDALSAMPAGRLGWLVGLALTVGAIAVAFSRFSQGPLEDHGLGEAAALVSMWNEAGSETAPNGDADSEIELAASDDVPEWLIAAVATGGAIEGGAQVQEN